MDIRGPRLRKPSDEALAFTSSMAFDGRIARHVVAVNTAHMLALVESGEVSRGIGGKCIAFLLSARTEVNPVPNAEDYHQQLEQAAVDALGVETAGYLNFGKSRNDQVATAIRMDLRECILSLIESLCGLQDAALRLAKSKGKAVFPGYTHLQRAQPVTLAHYMFAYFDSFQRNMDRLSQLYQRVNLSPMGSAAMAGTSAKVDRRVVAGSLGFSGIVRNAMDGVSSRDVAVEALADATMVALDAGRLAEELILWSTSEFGLIELSDAYSASSSIMPQKKNPVVAETVRAKEGSVIGSLVAVCTILKALPYSYNLDLQETTPHIWRAMDDVLSSVRLLAGVLSTAKVNSASARRAVDSDYSTAVALANYLVKKHGLSFREAHAMVGRVVRESAARHESLQSTLRKAGGISTISGRKISLDATTVNKVLDAQNFLESIESEGGSNPLLIPSEIRLREKELASSRSQAAELRNALLAAEKKLRAKASGMAREVKQTR